MIARKLGFDLKNIDYGMIKKRNNTAIFVLGLMFVIFFLVFISFFFLWLAKIPIEIDGITRQSDEVEYQNFVTTFSAVFGSILLIFLISLLLCLLSKPKEYIVISKDINLNKIYIIHYKKNYDAIIIGDKVFLYNRLSNNYELLQNKEKIADLKDKHLFWERWDKVEKYKFVDKRKKTILNFKIEDPAIVFKFHYSIKKSSSNIPSRIFENITKSFARNNIGTSLNTYYFYDINRKNNLVLPETIAKIIDSEY